MARRQPARSGSGRVASSRHRPLAMQSGGQSVPRLASAAGPAVLVRLAWGSMAAVGVRGLALGVALGVASGAASGR